MQEFSPPGRSCHVSAGVEVVAFFHGEPLKAKLGKLGKLGKLQRKRNHPVWARVGASLEWRFLCSG